MQVRLLGPVDVMVDGDPRPVCGLRRKAVLAVLALRGGEIVSTGQLAGAVWGQAAPPTAVNTRVRLVWPHGLPRRPSCSHRRGAQPGVTACASLAVTGG
jgi:hypothetical protein